MPRLTRLYVLFSHLLLVRRKSATVRRGKLTRLQWAEADKKAEKIKSQTESYVKDAKAEAIKAVDKFDKTVEDGAAKAKSGISGWFGGGSK